jgi:septum formation protein
MRISDPKIVLASGSPRRKALLKSLGVNFSVLSSRFDERKVTAIEPKAYVKKLAALKAKEVSKRVKKGIIIGADTVVVIGKKILNKPKDAADARRMLKLLSGKTHTVITGVCVINNYNKTSKIISVSARVRFKRLSEKTINWYISTKEPLDKAGAYAIQGKGAILIEGISGDYNNIVGLPLAALSKILLQMGVPLNGR